MFRTLMIASAMTVCATGAMAEGMEITKNGTNAGMMGSPDLFTGDVYVEMVFENKDPFVVNSGKVTFMPGARSNWHTHPAGQMLIVTEGTGWVQEEGKEKHVMQPGDVVWCPPGVKHWHGATDTTSVTHYAVQQFEDGKNVEWLEPVTDAQFTE
ncbi:cupin domain-containing protein [Thalassospira sp.]|uniref:(R)-mandelonitrile lyase n=1 Tax=Thalassospira sp. TaxID=1912094 RepID=UPI0025E4A776|nr:cupin domain-containing protein [Thalassospira sp.]